MRIDKFLKVSRLIKRRSVSKAACDSGRIFINDRQAKPGSNVAVGDIVTINFGNHDQTIKVLDLKESVKKDEAHLMYEILS